MRQRDSDGMVEVTVNAIAPAWEPLEDFIASVRKAAEDLEDAKVATVTEWETTYVTVTGWRDPTLAELVEIGVNKQREERAAREQLRRLRHNYPGLFDKQGRPKEDITLVNNDEVPF